MRILKVSTDTVSVISASMMSAIGATFFLILPLFLGALAEEFNLSDAQIGLLGSAYLAGFTVVSTSAVIWINRFSWRHSTMLGLTLLIAGSVFLTSVDEFPFLAAITSVIGGGAGAVFAVATRIISGVKNPDRAFGIKLVAEQVCGATLIFAIPFFFLPKWGLVGLIGVVVVVFVLLGVAVFWLPEKAGEPHKSKQATPASGTIYVWLGLLGLMIFMLGLSGIWAFIERIGDDAGLSSASIGAMLSIGVLFGAMGAALAAILGDVLGHKVPHIAGASLLLLCIFLLSGNLTVLVFGVAASLLSGMWNFMLAYQMGSVARLDVSLRMTVLIAPAIALGATLGPGIAGLIKTGTGYGPIYVLAVVSVVASAVLFVALDNRAGRNLGK